MYIAVLGCTLAVTVIGLSALALTRVERRHTEGASDFALARLHARTAIEIGMAYIEDDPNWRTTFASGSWIANQPIGTGSFSLNGVDGVDGNLGNHDTDPVILKGIGRQNDTRYMLQVTLTAVTPPLDCLDLSLHAGNILLFTNALVESNQTISANNSVSESGSTINADVEAVNSISGTGYTGTTTTGINPRTMPDPATVFDHYIATGAAIDVAALPTSGGEPILADIVLSPASNPYGPTNAQGIYVIDLQGQRLTIRNCRIVGTIVLLNGAANSNVSDSLHWEPAEANYPSLMVRGDFEFNTNSTQPLSESSPAVVNFNPLDTPYGADEDEDTLDTYPSVIKGLVYVSGNASAVIGSYPAFEGVVVVGATMTTASSLNLTYQPTFRDNPPPGFTDTPEMKTVSTSWRRIVE